MIVGSQSLEDISTFPVMGAAGEMELQGASATAPVVSYPISSAAPFPVFILIHY